jgi:outer membrane protein TolC
MARRSLCTPVRVALVFVASLAAPATVLLPSAFAQSASPARPPAAPPAAGSPTAAAGTPAPAAGSPAGAGAAPAAALQIPPHSSSVPDAPRPPAQPLLESNETPVKPLTFDGAVQAALARNPTAEEAQEEVRRYHALMEQVRSAALPTLNGIGTYTRLDNDRVFNGIVYAPRGSLNLNATLDVPIIYPQRWVLWGEASDLVDVAKANALDVRRTVAVATGRAYLAILTQKSLADTARTARDNAKAHYEFTRAQRIGGVGNRLDEVRAAQEFTSDEVNLQTQEIALLRDREALGVFVAGSGPADAAEDWNPATMPDFSDAMNETQTLRPDVRARDRATQAAERTVHDAWADYMPWLNIIAYPFYQDPRSVTVPKTGWQAELILNVPIYDGGLRYGQEHERSALASEARLSAEQTLRQARSDVRVAFEEIQRADIALDQAQQSAAFARRALELADIAYKAGATTNLEVIDAERQARDADDQAAIAEDAAREARLDLLAASGRFP